MVVSLFFQTGLSGFKGIADGFGHLGDRAAGNSHIFSRAVPALIVSTVAGGAADLHVRVGGAAAGCVDSAAGFLLEGTAEGLVLHDGTVTVDFDAVAAAKARHADVLMIDTAGRLHNKKNLMEELRKMNKIIDREFPEAYRETLVVLDATTGQNALQQAKEFNDVAEITGIVLTKMDGTAKGGIAVAIHAELGVPVKYIGVGETIDDLQKFDADDFVNALFERPKDDETSEEVSENK